MERIRQHPADDLPKPEPGIPDAEAWRLFGFRVPLAADEHQRGRDGGFEDAEEDAHGEESAVAMGRGGAGCRDAPEDDVGGEPFRGGDFLEDDACATESACIVF